MNLKSFFKLTFVTAMVATLVYSCNFGDYPGFKKTESGVYYKIYNSDNEDTTQVRTGSVVTMSLSYGIKDSMVFDSRDMDQPVMMSVTEPQYEGDFFEALKLFRQGDSATFILKAGPFFTKTVRQPSLPNYATEETDLYFNVVLNKVQTQEQVEAERQAKNEVLRQNEVEYLQKYIQDNNITTPPSNTGVYYLETKKGSGKSPEKDGYVSVHFTVFLLGQPEKLFSTLDKGEPIDFKFGSQFENKGFQEAVGQMKEGGKANAIVPSAMAFGEQGAGNIVPPFSTLYYEIELVNVYTAEEWEKKQADVAAKKQAEQAQRQMEEESVLQKYLQDNNIVPTTTLPNGLIYIERQAGTGKSPVDGKKVKVHYTGKLLNGEVFDSSVDRGEPFEFTLGRKNVIEGWDAGIPLMKEGGKATLIIPSKIGYKDRGAGEKIPPYSTLVFEVELIEAEQ